MVIVVKLHIKKSGVAKKSQKLRVINQNIQNPGKGFSERSKTLEEEKDDNTMPGKEEDKDEKRGIENGQECRQNDRPLRSVENTRLAGLKKREYGRAQEKVETAK